MSEWLDIATAPRDGTRFWIKSGDNAIAVFWHPQFEAFVSGFNRMTLARGMTFEDTGLDYKDHSPVTHNGKWWQPLPEPPQVTT